MRVLRSGDRFETVQPGIRTWHCFSAGAHYDPSRLGVGALVGVDEHHVDPGAGFRTHGHRGVDIVSWVVAGVLRHEDDAGRVRLVRPGSVQVQVTGPGVRHSEVNASRSEPLVLVQMTLVAEAAERAYRCTSDAAVTLSAGRFAALQEGATLEAALVYAFVVSGSWSAGGVALGAGDSCTGSGPMRFSGRGRLLAWQL